MKNVIFTLFCLAAILPLFAQINFTFPNTLSINSSGNFAVPSAMLDVESTTRGILIPRMTTAQRLAIPSPAVGLLVFDTDKGGFYYRAASGGGTWLPMGLKQLADCDADTRITVETSNDEDEIRMYLGEYIPGPLLSTQVLVLRRNSGTVNGSTMLEIFDNSGNDNLFIGQNAGSANTTGVFNTATGFQSLNASTTGSFNTATGAEAMLANTTGSGNTANGFQALYFNTTGNNNTANGGNALANNTSGADNAAFGAFALNSNTTGNDNTAGGSGALYSNTTGYSNTAHGNQALYFNTSGYANTAVGDTALIFNTTGERNTAVGYAALYSNNTGIENTSIGYHANGVNITGSFNTAVGYSTGAGAPNGTYNTAVGYSANIGFGLTNSTALGNGVVTPSSNEVCIGNAAVTVIGGPVPWSHPSDGRFKSGIRNDVPGLSFISKLKPVTYHFDYTGYSKFLGEKSVDENRLRQKEQKVEIGFVAQELEQAMRESGLEVSNLVHVPEHEKDHYSIAYSQLVVPLVQAVQEQQAQIEDLKTQNQSLQAQLDELRSEMQAFKAASGKQVIPNENN